jgi:hypothetical protein
VYAFDADGTLARVEPRLVLTDLEPTASIDDVAIALQGGLSTVRLPLVHDGNRVHRRRANDEIATLTVAPGTSTTDPTRSFDERLRDLPYPDGTHAVRQAISPP